MSDCENRCESTNVFWSVVENDVAFLHPAVSPERTGLYSNDASGELTVIRKESREGERIKQARILRAEEQRPKIEEHFGCPARGLDVDRLRRRGRGGLAPGRTHHDGSNRQHPQGYGR